MAKTLDTKLLLKMFNEELGKRQQEKAPKEQEPAADDGEAPQIGKKPKNVDLTVKHDSKVPISPGLIIRKKMNDGEDAPKGYEYTVKSVNGNDVCLTTPEGKPFMISIGDLKKYTI